MGVCEKIVSTSRTKQGRKECQSLRRFSSYCSNRKDRHLTCPGLDSKTAVLEEKLESLVKLLKTPPGDTILFQAGLSQPAATANAAIRQDCVPESRSDIVNKPHHEECDFKLNQFPSRYTSAPPTCICRVPFNEEEVGPFDSDENLLSIYMKQLCCWFPFVAFHLVYLHHSFR